MGGLRTNGLLFMVFLITIKFPKWNSYIYVYCDDHLDKLSKTSIPIYRPIIITVERIQQESSFKSRNKIVISLRKFTLLEKGNVIIRSLLTFFEFDLIDFAGFFRK